MGGRAVRHPAGCHRRRDHSGFAGDGACPRCLLPADLGFVLPERLVSDRSRYVTCIDHSAQFHPVGVSEAFPRPKLPPPVSNRPFSPGVITHPQRPPPSPPPPP